MGRRRPLPRYLLPVLDGPIEVPEPVADREQPPPPAQNAPRRRPPRPLEGTPLARDLAALRAELAPKLQAAGLLAGVDEFALEMAIRHFLAARGASEALLAAGGVVVTDPAHATVKAHPAHGAFLAESAAFLTYAKQLGLSFDARARLPGRLEDAGDDFFAAPPGPEPRGPA